MWGADFRRREDARVNFVTHASKIRPHIKQPNAHVPPHVLKKTPLGFNISNDVCNARPEMSRVGCPEPFPGNTERLTGITTNDSRHAAAPRASIEGVEVCPDRRVIQGTVRNTRSQDFAGSDFVFHVADRSSSVTQSKADSKIKSPGS